MKKYIMVSMICVFSLTMSACKITRENDVEKYQECLDDYSYKTELTLFPDKIDDESCVNEFYHYSMEAICSDDMEMYLDCTYDEETYDKEINRLSKEKDTYYEDDERKSEYDDSSFQYPAYIMAFDDDYIYEYALTIEKENRIIYVYLDCMPTDRMKLASRYIPKEYDEPYKE